MVELGVLDYASFVFSGAGYVLLLVWLLRAQAYAGYTNLTAKHARRRRSHAPTGRLSPFDT